mgnify:FL=1|tara:strand:+ start:389 stop:580 length:192 start_codon:yes stop_codon:yes gene_type:complete
MKTLNARLDGESFMLIDEVLHSIVQHHDFDDFGVTLDTYKVMNYAGELRVVHSDDEGKTFYEE